MRFKGKIALWYWALVIIVNLALCYSFYEAFLTVDQAMRVITLIICGIFVNIVLLPILFRNYIVMDSEKVTIYFGFIKYCMKIHEIESVKSTYNPLSSMAASLDRLLIKGRGETMVSVEDKEGFVKALKEKNPAIRFDVR